MPKKKKTKCETEKRNNHLNQNTHITIKTPSTSHETHNNFSILFAALNSFLTIIIIIIIKKKSKFFHTLKTQVLEFLSLAIGCG